MKLHEGAINGTYRVVAINNLELPVERRLEAIGLTNGTNITILNKKKKGDKMSLSEEKVEFDLSALSLQELMDVYKNIVDFLDFLQENKITLGENDYE